MNAHPSIFPVAMATVAVLAVAACQDVDSPDGSDTRMEEQDSADVRIVENARPADGSRLGWRIGTEPAVTIGKLEGEEPYMLFVAMDATRLSDGRIVVVNAGTHELRVFDGAGIHMDTWGGRGDGPGEFRAPIGQVAHLPGDSVVVWSPQQPFLTVFDPTGSVVRRVQVLKRQPELRGDAILPTAVLARWLDSGRCPPGLVKRRHRGGRTQGCGGRIQEFPGHAPRAGTTFRFREPDNLRRDLRAVAGKGTLGRLDHRQPDQSLRDQGVRAGRLAGSDCPPGSRDACADRGARRGIHRAKGLPARRRGSPGEQAQGL